MSHHGAARDTIQISLGSTANAVTAHSLNLQGLAVTTGNPEAGEQPVCDAQTTHHVQNNHWVPRVLMIDEPTRYFVPQISSPANLQQQQQQYNYWGGAVETFADPNLTLQHETPAWGSVHSNASALAYSSHSRYYQEPVTTNNSYKASQSNPRHVVWDDDDGDNDREEEPEDPQDRLSRLRRERSDWNRTTQAPLQEDLKTQDWDDLFQKTTNFMDIWMPPYSPKSLLAIPYSHQTSMVSNWDAYHFGREDSSLKEWKEDVLFESVRRLLEESDGCQGVSITTDGSGIYAGLTTALLQELQEECTSAGRIVYHVQDDNDVTKTNDEESNWHSLHVDRLRRHVGSGLALHDFCQNAHAVLPLQVPATTLSNKKSLLEATAELALALEAATLPFRLSPRTDPRYQVGLLNAPFFGGQDTQWGSSGQRLSVSEFLQCLQPSSRYSVLELDVMSTLSSSDSSNATVWDALKAGTSVERDLRMRETGRDGQLRRPRDEAPGGWLEDTQHGGILTSLSHRHHHDASGNRSGTVSRSLHHHFALSTSVRTVLQGDMADYSTSLIQGMGIRYRPERSMCTVLDQTVGQLTRSGAGGAGAYWSRVIGAEAPVVAVVGNTTRIHPHLERISAELKTVLGPRYRGYYQRDLVSGILPELEDCEEAVAHCLDIRDAYQPPDGSGLVRDDGEDFL
jgi:hypothetical protein